MMKIGMMADIYTPHISGVTHSIKLTKQVLQNKGHEVFVFTFGDLDYEDEEENIIRSPGVPLADTGIYLGFRHTSATQRLIQRMDILHVHHPFISGQLALHYGRPYRIPIVFTNHSRYELMAQAYFPLLPDQVGTALLGAYLPRFCREVDLVIAPSKGVERLLRELDIDVPVEIIPNGVDLSPFAQEIDPISREELGVGKSDVLLINVGRLSPEKNLTFLIRAFAGVQAAYPETHMLLIGKGPERDNIEHLTAQSGLDSYIHFGGAIEYEQIPRFLAAADAFVMCSVAEVLPLSVIEALAAGLPVLGIHSPGVSDMVVDGENGLLSTNDLAVFTAKLVRLVSDRELRIRLGQNARSSAEEYSIERTSGLLEGHYIRLRKKRAKERRRLPSLWPRFWDRIRRR
jgi:1,2-diacylglycerol 3-alpha-glucosyltransferase